MMNFEKITKWLNYNRFTVVCPLIGLVIWFAAIGCNPTAFSPESGRQVDAVELETDFQIWKIEQEKTLLKFDVARADIEKQTAAWNEFQELLVKLSTGNVADWSGLLQLLMGGGLMGALSDNVRKRGLIAGLKRNKGP